MKSPQSLGFLAVDTVAHCGPTLKGEFARTLTLVDVAIGWMHPEVMHNNAHKYVRAALDAAMDGIPYQVQGLDCDNGSELVNYNVLGWTANREACAWCWCSTNPSLEQWADDSTWLAVPRKCSVLRIDTETLPPMQGQLAGHPLRG